MRNGEQAVAAQSEADAARMLARKNKEMVVEAEERAAEAEQAAKEAKEEALKTAAQQEGNLHDEIARAVAAAVDRREHRQRVPEPQRPPPPAQVGALAARTLSGPGVGAH